MSKEEIKVFENTKSSEDWDSACDDLKKANGGGYPKDWFVTMIASGKLNEIAAGWDEPVEDADSIRISTF